MKTFERLDELMDHLVVIHEEFKQLYQELRNKCKDPRVALLLDDMMKNEQRLKTLIRQFKDQAEPCVLHTYLQYTLEESLNDLTAELRENLHGVQLEDINGLGQSVYGYQIDVIEEALRETASEHVHQLLENILQLLEAEQHNFSKRVLSGYEI